MMEIYFTLKTMRVKKDEKKAGKRKIACFFEKKKLILH